MITATTWQTESSINKNEGTTGGDNSSHSHWKDLFERILLRINFSAIGKNSCPDGSGNDGVVYLQ